MMCGRSLGAEMVVIDIIAPQWLYPAVVSFQILLLVVEKSPEVVSLILAHLEHLLRHNPV
jgi:hypothetical protein